MTNIINIAIALAILSGAMYLAISVIDAVAKRFHLFPNRYNKPASQTEQLIDSFANSLSLAEHSTYNNQAIANCEIEAEAFCSETANLAGELIDGVSASAESAGEQVSLIIEGLANH
ncbi:MAG: hypothetical protein AAFQ41_12230 [Cyanobacteria bacterium J06623_7]